MIKKNFENSALRRCASRLAAVQALYQLDVGQGRLEDTLHDFLSGAIGGEVIDEGPDLEVEEVVSLIALNAELFSILVRGVDAHRARLDEVIDGSLSQAWDPQRLQPILRNVLRCGLYELMERSTVPPRAAVAEYVDIARSFYDGPEAGLANAVLDRLARQLRRQEMETPRHDGGAAGERDSC